MIKYNLRLRLIVKIAVIYIHALSTLIVVFGVPSALIAAIWGFLITAKIIATAVVIGFVAMQLTAESSPY